MKYPSSLGARFDHASFGVVKGKMPQALQFLRHCFGWHVERRVKGTWGQARFVWSGNPNDIPVQITEELELPNHPTGDHLAIRLMDVKPKKMAGDILAWALSRGLRCKIYSSNKRRTKWMLELPDILKFDIELV